MDALLVNPPELTVRVLFPELVRVYSTEEPEPEILPALLLLKVQL